MVKKNFKAILYVNWKTGAMKIFRRKPKNSSPWEVGIHLDLDVEIPDMNANHTFKANIVVPETQVNDMIMESI